MSSISVLPISGLAVASPVKPGASASSPATTNETAKSQSTTQGSPSVIYPSPTTSIDPATSQLVIEYRDHSTGVAEYQSPTKAQLRLYEISQSRVDVPGQEPTTPAVPAATLSNV